MLVKYKEKGLNNEKLKGGLKIAFIRNTYIL